MTASVCAQSKTKLVENKLEAIEKYLYQNPVAAKSDLLKLLQRKDEVPDSTLGTIYMNLATVLGMTNRLDSAIQASNEAIRLLPEQSVNKATALKLKAIVYRLKGEWKPAEETIELLLQLNDSIWKNDMLEAMTLQEYASLCLDRYDYSKATNLYLEALNVINSTDFKGPEKPFTAIKLQVNLAEAYMRAGNYLFSIREFNSAMPVLDSLKDFEGFVRAGYQLVEAYIRSGQALKADSLLNVLMPITVSLHNEELQSYILYKKGDVQASKRNYAGALPYYRSAFGLLEKNKSPVLLECTTAYLKSLKRTGSDEEARQVLDSKVLNEMIPSSLKEEQLEFRKSALPFIGQDLTNTQLLAYMENLIDLNDSVATDKEKRSAIQIQAQYQFERQREKEDLLTRENEVLKEREHFKQKQLYFSVSIAILLLTILGLLVIRLRQRASENERRLQAKEQELQFQKERREWAEREKDLRDQLIQQQKAELIRSVEDATELRTKLEQLVSEQQEDKRKELLTQIENSKNEKQSMESLLSQFNAVYPTFAASLLKRYPGLSQADVQFCTLYRMNLTTKEISVLLNIEPRSVYIKKYRVVEKMGLSETEQFEQVLFCLS
jgi:hypothetical protein